MNHLLEIKREIPPNVRLVVVSKTVQAETVLEIYNQDHKIFGENRAQSLIEKQPLLPDDIEWHFIGHLQTNKVKYIAPFIHMIHSVDSLKLMKEIDKEALKNRRLIRCLLQFHIASEQTKFGLDPAEARKMLDDPELKMLKHIRICGVMGMATLTDNESLVRQEFRKLKSIFDQLKDDYFSGDEEFSEISMGMSGDFRIAIEEGSTMVRIGTAIFA